jgi:hypothetical protein
VEIMSPHDASLPDGNASTIPRSPEAAPIAAADGEPTTG